MSFNGNEGDAISLTDAAAYTANYRGSNFNNGVNAHFFGVEKLKRILEQDGCKGIRAYYGLSDEGVPQLVLVGADEHENDMTNGIILDRSVPCPSFCGQKNPLNS